MMMAVTETLVTTTPNMVNSSRTVGHGNTHIDWYFVFGERTSMIPPMIGTLNAAIPIFERAMTRREAGIQEALTALLDALLMTEEYVGNQPAGQDQNLEHGKQLELVKVWGIAAIKCRKSFPNDTWIADKMNYWLEHANWCDDEIYDHYIDLETVRIRVVELLKQ